MLNERELKAVSMALNGIELARQSDLENADENFCGRDQLHKLFDCGLKSFGQHEASDRAYIVMENWETYVQQHPTILLNPQMYRLASLAHAFMWATYQAVGTADANEPEVET